MDNRNFAIGILSTTAVILLVGFFLVSSRPDPVYAAGMEASSGNYTMVVSQLSDAEEMLIVIDSTAAKMGTFSYEPARRSIVPIQLIDLNAMRKATANQSGATQPTDPRNRKRPPRTRPGTRP